MLFFAVNFFSPRALGFGDVRLAPVLGLGLGWLGVGYVVLGFFAANLIGAVIGLALIATKQMTRQQQIPYGVFLALGTGLAFFWGPELLRPFRPTDQDNGLRWLRRESSPLLLEAHSVDAVHGVHQRTKGQSETTWHKDQLPEPFG